ncbi:MAG: protease complex subunit PrcB family protein [Actinobacteria bacterium]|nr:protease complex subunit PrcB family protein [Actinomycetota bacterium]
MKKIKIFLSLLLIFSIFLLLFLFSCGKENRDKIALDTISKGKYSQQAEKEYFVIKDTESFNQLLAKISNGDSEITNKDVDFSKEMVVGVFLGEKPTGGYTVEISDVLKQDKYIEFLIKINEPNPGEIVTEAITSPYHIIKLKKSDMEIVFNIIEQE